jgi:hypothetical protein
MRPVRRADNLTTFVCRLSRNSGSLNLQEPYVPVQGQLYLYRCMNNIYSIPVPVSTINSDITTQHNIPGTLVGHLDESVVTLLPWQFELVAVADYFSQICKIWRFHSADIAESGLVECNVV